MFVIPETSHAH